jgi:proteasome accessory factor C
VARHRQVEIEHLSLATGERRTRTVDPWHVVHESGTWYLLGHDHLRDEARTFRVDRIVDVRVLEGAPARPAPDGAGRPSFAPADTDPRVTVELAPSARWVVETYPVEDVEVLDDGRLRVTMAIATRAFLESLLVRLGPAATVVEAPDALAGAGPAAARRVLARYR